MPNRISLMALGLALVLGGNPVSAKEMPIDDLGGPGLDGEAENASNPLARDWISPDINAGAWEGYTPPPLPTPPQ